MLTRHGVLGEAACVEGVPTIGFVTTDDGRTLVALTEHDDGLLEIMAAPMTLITQNPAASNPIFKSIGGNLLLNPPVFQINVEDMGGSGVQRTILLPTQPIDNGSNTLEQSQTIESTEDQSTASLVADLTSFGIEDLPESKKGNKVNTRDNVQTATEKGVQKKSPGRPKKTEANERLKCDICGREFTKQSLYRKHMDHHAEEKPHRCPKCPASFNIPSNFTLHMATHNTGDPKCPECGRKFARMASLKSHMLHHEKEENLFCTECEDAFATKAQLDAHLKLHGEKWSSDEARKCKLCNKQFTQPALYRLHIREHYRLQTRVTKQTKRGAKHKTMYKCTICLKSFQKPSQLMRHIRVHTGEKPFKCTVCGRGFTQKSSLQIHTWQHNGIRPHTCELCHAKFSQKGNLNAHILRVHNAAEGEPIYACSYCSCVFKKLGSLNGHVKRTHANASAENLERNEESLTEADMRATVDSVMSQLASLESTSHPEINNKQSTTPVTETPVSRENVSAEIAARDDILQQALDNSGLTAKKDELREKIEAETSFVTLLDRSSDGGTGKYLTIKQRCIGNVRWYACSFCHKEFKKPSDLFRHLRVHTQEKPFKCAHCFRSFALKSTMIAHERTHTATKKYACSSCDKMFACQSSLAAHTRAQHGDANESESGGKSNDGGKVQGKTSKSKSKFSPETESLVQDVILQEPLVISDLGNRISVAQVASKQNQVYDGKSEVARPHKCWVCHAAFRKISHLKQHYRRHTGERPYKCTKCDRRFTSNSVLKSHLHTHEDSRPYSCSVCNTKFSTQSSMKRHLVTHSTRRPFMCPYCHKTFKTYVNCRKHMKIHKHELAQRQLDQQKTPEQTGQEVTLNVEVKNVPSVLSESLTLPESLEMSFPPQIEPVFTQNLTEHLQSIAEAKEKSILATSNEDTTINTPIPETLQDVDTGITNSQILHTDDRGTVTLPGYAGDQTLTAESIREIEETLNQQFFSIGMNLGLGGNLSRQMDEPNTSALDNAREELPLTVPYETSKEIGASPSNVFASQFDSFDMSHITLQPDVEIDMGLVDATNTTSMASILPKSAKEEGRLISVTAVSSETQTPIAKTSVTVSTSTEDSHDALSLTGNCRNPTNGVQIIVSCDNGTLPMSLAGSLTGTPDGQNQEDTRDALLSEFIDSTANESVRLTDSLLQCHLCSERGFTAEGLKVHLKTHRGTKEYQCSECSLRFCTNGGLNRHSKMHASKQQWKCSVCHKIVASKMQLKLHSKEHENTFVLSQQNNQIQVTTDPLTTGIPSTGVEVELDASISQKVLMDTVAEKEVMERLNCIPRKKEQKEYTNKCKYCPKTFRKPSDLIRHTRTHTGERPYKCDFCSKSFAVKCTLDSHVKVHTGKRTFRCHVCSSLFATKGSLKVHMRLHTGSRPFRCPICDLRFRTSGHRKVHLLKHTRESKGLSPKRKQKNFKVTAVAEAAAALDTDHCTNKLVGLPLEAQLDNPQTTDYNHLHEVIGIEGSDLTDQITFSTDGTIINNNSVLSVNESNQIVANLNFLLANGLVTIQTDDTGLLSQATAPGGATIIPTDTVSLAVNVAAPETTATILGTNLETNTITEPVTMPSISLLNVQPKIAGKTERQPIKQTTRGTFSKKECDICGKTFMKPYQVERHKRIHTGERPYKCQLCAKSFAQKSTLQMHQKHHTGDRPHPCPHCELSFTQKGNLRTHVKRVHQLDTLDIKKLRRSRQNFAPKPIQAAIPEAKILTFDDISFVEFLK